jgi:hypothetical protein
MVANALPFPPTERDFEVYESVVVEGKSTRKAAADFGVSQTRIVQIATRVAEWIAVAVPPSKRLTPAQRLVVAGDIAGRRMDHLYCLAIQAWNKSQGPKVVERSSLSGDATIATESFGDVRYLNQAARIVERAGKMAWQDRPRQRQADQAKDAVASDPPHDAERWESPPEEDCSAPSPRQPEPAFASAERSAASLGSATTLSDIERRRQEFLNALERDTSPVQPP